MYRCVYCYFSVSMSDFSCCSELTYTHLRKNNGSKISHCVQQKCFQTACVLARAQCLQSLFTLTAASITFGELASTQPTQENWAVAYFIKKLLIGWANLCISEWTIWNGDTFHIIRFDTSYYLKTFSYFSISQKLALFRYTHSSRKPFQCEFCGKGFCQSRSLQQHKLKHAKVRSCVYTTC